MGWAAIKNGELLSLASQEFEAFITVDRNLSFQQNLGDLPIAAIVLEARIALDFAKPGAVKIVRGA